MEGRREVGRQGGRVAMGGKGGRGEREGGRKRGISCRSVRGAGDTGVTPATVHHREGGGG